jgi:CheY-like chemotaxis protein
MNSALADAIWRRKYEEADKSRRSLELQLKLMTFCLKMRRHDGTLVKEVEAFLEGAQRFMDSLRHAGGWETDDQQAMLEDIRLFVEGRNDQVVIHLTALDVLSAASSALHLSGLQVNVTAAGPTGAAPGRSPAHQMDSVLLQRMLLVQAQCALMTCSDRALTADVELGDLEGTAALVVAVPVVTEALPDAIANRPAQEYRMEHVLPLSEVGLGLFLCKAYTERLGGYLFHDGSTTRTVIPLMDAAHLPEPPPSAPPETEPPPPPPPARPAPYLASQAADRRPPPLPRPPSPALSAKSLSLSASSSDSGGSRTVSPASRPHGASFGRPLSVLIVDDNELNLKVMANLFKGHNVTKALTARAAVDLFRKQFFSIVFIDIVLPDFSGIEAARQMLADVQAKRKDRVPIIAVSGQNLETSEQEAIEAGISDFYPKPLTKNAVNAVLTKYFG